MKANLDSLLSEIHTHLQSAGLAAFPSLGIPDGERGIYWDAKRHPDYREFVATALTAGVRLVTVSAREFDGDEVEEALAHLDAAQLGRDERRAIESRLLEMQRYEGFTCQIELAFDLAGRAYVFSLRTDWFDDLQELLDRIEDSFEEPDSDEGDDEAPLSGYFSNN